MKSFLKLGILVISLACSMQSFAQANGNSDRLKNYKEDCKTNVCRDPWVSQAYYEVWGNCTGATGDNGNCNYRLYGGGQWSSYGDLVNKVRAAYTGPCSMGKIYVFMRPTDALTFGHMGWGIQLSDGSYYCGATENPMNVQDLSKTLAVPNGQDIHSWTMRFNTEADMFARMRSMSYTKWKGLAVANPQVANAKSLIDRIKDRGYGGIGNNCMDHAFDVFTYYGVSWTKLPLKSTFPVPNEWFRRFYPDNSNNGAEGWNL